MVEEKSKIEIVIVGAGIIGLTLARHLLLNGYRHVLLLEKEKAPGLHSSTHNSAIIHAGIYYKPGSLKAKLCMEGASLLKQYCKTKNVPLLECGKWIVTKNVNEIESLHNLYKNGKENGVNLEIKTEDQVKSEDPNVKTKKEAILSSDTAAFSNTKLIEALADEVTSLGCKTLTFNNVTGVDPASNEITIETYNSKKVISYEYLFNTAGLHADTIASEFNIGKNLEFIPFRGAYLECIDNPTPKFNRCVYPVPDPAFPFLGLHITLTTEGSVLLGPTAAPAFDRENYSGLNGVSLPSLIKQSVWLAKRYLTNENKIRTHTNRELPLLCESGFRKEAISLSDSFKNCEFIKRSDFTGIRAQLYDRTTKSFLMDFKLEKTDYSTHVLNTVSPGMTSSLAFAKYIHEFSGI